MIFGPPATESLDSVRLLRPFWEKIVDFLHKTLESVLDGEAECDLEFVENPDPICVLQRKANSQHTIILSTGLMIRIAVIAKVVSSDFLLYGVNTPGMPGILDGVYYDDFPDDSIRERIINRPPPPGMGPAFSPNVEFDVLLNWASVFLDFRLWEHGPLRKMCEPICLYALSFLVTHEAAHLILAHHTILKKISTQSIETISDDQKCVEIHADFGAASAMLLAMKSVDISGDLESYLHLSSVGIMIALCFGKHTQRGLRSYDHPIDEPRSIRAYPHPAVRQALIERLYYDRISIFLNEDEDELISIYRIIVISRIRTASALNCWYIDEIRREAKGDVWGVPHPYNYLPEAFRMTQRAAREIQNLLFPAYVARHFSDRGNPLPPWSD